MTGEMEVRQRKDCLTAGIINKVANEGSGDPLGDWARSAAGRI